MTHVIQKVLTILRAGEWMPVTAARVLIGIFFCISGRIKRLCRAEFGVLEQTMVRDARPVPATTTLFVAAVGFACGAMWRQGSSAAVRRNAHDEP